MRDVVRRMWVAVAASWLIPTVAQAQSLGVVDCRASPCVSYGWFDWLMDWLIRIGCWFGLC